MKKGNLVKLVMVLGAVFIVAFLVVFCLFLYGLRGVVLRQYAEENQFVTSQLDSRGFDEASFLYKVLCIYWDDRNYVGRRLALQRMLKTADTIEEWEEIYKLTPVWDPEEHEKVKKELKKLGVLLD